jgi:pimeloyl-ACP methyl ester carboxylesterase
VIRDRVVTANGIRLAVRDSGGAAPPMLALHGHFSRGLTFDFLAEALAGSWRVIAPDQRGHGASDKPGVYTRDAYVDDAADLLRAMDTGPAVVLGHSLGGINAYQLAARHPDLVRALIVEDIGVDLGGDFTDFLAGWPETFPTRKAARTFIASRAGMGVGFFLESLDETPDGWRIAFRIPDMIESQRHMNGNWWHDWTASPCPALLVHGVRSFILGAAHAREMAARRPRTRLVDVADAGHDVHFEQPERFADVVRAFLADLSDDASRGARTASGGGGDA